MNNNQPLVRYVNPPGAAPAQGLYSHAATVHAGDLHFIAGQLAVADDGSLVGPNDFEAQFLRVFANLEGVLRALGCEWNHIAKFTTYFVNERDIEVFMALRARHFPRWFGSDVFPPNTICVIRRLVKEGFLFEVEAVARAVR